MHATANDRAEDQPPRAGLLELRRPDTDQLRFHLDRAVENGLTEDELVDVITHGAFYAGWPKGMAAMGVARELFAAE